MQKESPNQRASIVSHIQVGSGHYEQFGAWQLDLNMLVASRRGFVDAQIIPPVPGEQTDWVIVQNFERATDASAWLESDERQQQVEQIQPWLSAPDSINIVVGPDAQHEARTAVTAVITTAVRPGKEEEFQAWRARIVQVEQAYPGHERTDFQPPIEGVNPNWLTFIRFDTNEHLRGWLDSDERAQLIAEATSIEDTAYRTTKTSFSGWFPEADGAAKPPPGWKFTAIVLLVLYPVVILEVLFLAPRISGLGVGLATFVANAISVSLTGFLLIPLAGRSLKWWLFPTEGKQSQRTLVGALLLVALYGLSVLIFSLLASVVR